MTGAHLGSKSTAGHLIQRLLLPKALQPDGRDCFAARNASPAGSVDIMTRAAKMSGAAIVLALGGVLSGGALSAVSESTPTVLSVPSQVAPAPSSSQGPGGGILRIHPASACYSGLNCGCIHDITCAGSHRHRRGANPPPNHSDKAP